MQSHLCKRKLPAEEDEEDEEERQTYAKMPRYATPGAGAQALRLAATMPTIEIHISEAY